LNFQTFSLQKSGISFCKASRFRQKNGVLAPIGKRVSFDEVVFLEIRDGKVVSQRGVADNLTALRQLGV
jgi:predicted ester cyclase